MKRRGQAAMEFLMTYGWAILAAIIAIGVLAYFGVFSPGQYIGSSAIVTAPFYANAWNVDATSVNIELQNNGGETLVIERIALTDLNGADSCTAIGQQLPLNSGNTAAYSITCQGLVAGETFKADVSITYSKVGSSLNLTSTGSITDTVV